MLELGTHMRLDDVRRRRRTWVAAAVLLAVLAAIAVAVLLWTHRKAAQPSDRSSVEAALPVPPPVEPVRNLEVDEATAREINAARPYLKDAVRPARPFRFEGDEIQTARAVACLAAAAWYEAGDDAEGQRSVVQTVLNRTRHPAFPSSVCGVVFQGSERTTGCQFSFTCDGAMRRTPSAAAWERARALSAAMLKGSVDASVGWATHYHTDWVVPYWSPNLAKIAKVKTHIFYVWPGYWGLPRAFAQKPALSEPRIAALSALSPAHLPIEGEPVSEVAGPEAIGPPAPPPPPIAMPGISQRSLGKNLVRGQSADADSFFVELDASAYPGSFAIAALAVCKGKATCSFYGWRDGSRMAHQAPLDAAQRESLSFSYVRDAQGERALWNCAQFQRANKAQCLPSAPPAAPSPTPPTPVK